MTEKEVSADQLYDLYVVKRFSVKEIAGHFGMSERSIYHRMAKFGITRTRSDKVKPYFTMRLSQEDAKSFVETILNRREPNKALREAAERYRRRTF